jgi:hypothetical protein
MKKGGHKLVARRCVESLHEFPVVLCAKPVLSFASAGGVRALALL